MMCGCTGLEHGQGMYYVLPEVSRSMPREDRLERFTVLVKNHPRLGQFDAKRMLMGIGGYPEIISRLDRADPIVKRFMEAYKTSTQFTEGHPMNLMDAEGLAQCRSDCDLAIRQFFAANWGHIKLFEWYMLNNAIQTQSNPEDFTGADLVALQTVINIVGGISDAYSNLKIGGEGAHALNYQLEDT